MPKRAMKTRQTKRKPTKPSIPPTILALLQQRGWHYPPTKAEIQRRLKAARRSSGMVRIDAEILRAMPEDDYAWD